GLELLGGVEARVLEHERVRDAEGRLEYARIGDVDDGAEAAEGHRGDDGGLGRKPARRGQVVVDRVADDVEQVGHAELDIDRMEGARWRLDAGERLAALGLQHVQLVREDVAHVHWVGGGAPGDAIVLAEDHAWRPGEAYAAHVLRTPIRIGPHHQMPLVEGGGDV